MEHEKDFESSEEKLVVKLNDIFLQDVNEEFTESIKVSQDAKNILLYYHFCDMSIWFENFY